MADKYHYDSKGNYTGKSSDDPPSSFLGAIVLIFIVLGLLGMCSSNKSDGNTSKVPQDPVINSSNKDPGPKWTVPQEEATTNSTQWTAPSPAPQTDQPKQWTVPQEEATTKSTQWTDPSPAPRTDQPKQWTIPKED